MLNARNLMQRRSVLTGLLAVPIALKASAVSACSLAFVNDRKIAKVVVRSMDLPASFPERPKLVVFPRGIIRNSETSVLPGITAKVEGISGKAMRWTSKFGGVAMVSFDGGSTDGLNEKGLSAHLLVLEDSQHEPKDDRPELPDIHWAQYVLDTFATVKEVIDAHNAGEFRLVAGWSSEMGYPKPLGLHLAVEDDSGDSAIFECVGGKLVIHHGPEYRVMTNDPPMDEMLVRLKTYKGFGGNEPLPGDLEPEHRFARLLAYYKDLPDPKTYPEAVGGALSLLRIAQVPFRDPTKGEGLWFAVQTNWVTATDVTNKIYYVNSATVPSLCWVDLKEANLEPNAPVLFLNPHDPKVGGDARSYLEPWKVASGSE